MLATKVACPRCGAGLKSAQPLPAGKTVKCPKCGVPFTVPAEGIAVTPSRSGTTGPPPLSAQGVQRSVSLPPPPLPVAQVAAAPTGFNVQRLGIVLGGSFVYLAVGMSLAVYCWSVNHKAEAAARSRTAAAAPAKKENAEPPLNPLPKEEQAAVELAINRGVRFLKTTQHPNGTWGGGEHAVGFTAFPGLSLLECGVPATDPNVLKAATFVRVHAPNLTFTYDLALSILFLDRLGDPKDKELIQTFALRLIAGQTGTGGWAYHCPILSPNDQKNLLTVLQGLRPKAGELYTMFQSGGLATVKEPGGLTTSGDADKDLDVMAAGKRPPEMDRLPPPLKRLPVLQDSDELKRGRRAGDNSDNSNTQFGLLGMWVGRRHDVPVERTMALIVKRFRSSQDPRDGSWHYKPNQDVAQVPTMTCAGLLGLAVGHGLANEAKAGEQKPDGDPAIDRGLKHLSQFIGTPSGGTVHNPAPNDPRRNFYYLWSVERVGVLYNLPTINQKQWYRWGSEYLLGIQNKNNGGWHDGAFPGTIDTCFALLFLRQANLAKDLTSKLQLLKKTG